ncbi:hypothetical protein D3C78_1954370 [compost metagenome]
MIFAFGCISVETKSTNCSIAVLISSVINTSPMEAMIHNHSEEDSLKQYPAKATKRAMET